MKLSGIEDNTCRISTTSHQRIATDWPNPRSYPNFPDHIIKMINLKTPYKDGAPKINEQKLTPLETGDRMDNSLARGRS